ncbi:MAG: hypothetical protein AB3N11_01660, partial [Arenibacterium sp.]
LYGGAGQATFRDVNVKDASVQGRTEQIFDFNIARDIIDFEGITSVELIYFGADALQTGKAGVATERSGSDTFVRVDADGDGQADMLIRLRDTIGVDAENFVL